MFIPVAEILPLEKSGSGALRGIKTWLKRALSRGVSLRLWDDISTHQHQIWAVYTLCRGLTCRYSWGGCSCLWEGGTVASGVPDGPKWKLRNSSIKMHRYIWTQEWLLVTPSIPIWSHLLAFACLGNYIYPADQAWTWRSFCTVLSKKRQPIAQYCCCHSSKGKSRVPSSPARVWWALWKELITPNLAFLVYKHLRHF